MNRRDFTRLALAGLGAQAFPLLAGEAYSRYLDNGLQWFGWERASGDSGNALRSACTSGGGDGGQTDSSSSGVARRTRVMITGCSMTVLYQPGMALATSDAPDSWTL